MLLTKRKVSDRDVIILRTCSQKASCSTTWHELSRSENIAWSLEQDASSPHCIVHPELSVIKLTSIERYAEIAYDASVGSSLAGGATGPALMKIALIPMASR